MVDFSVDDYKQCAHFILVRSVFVWCIRTAAVEDFQTPDRHEFGYLSLALFAVDGNLFLANCYKRGRDFSSVDFIFCVYAFGACSSLVDAEMRSR